MHAFVRAPSPRLADCELTHVARAPIDLPRAGAEHEAYVATPRALGCTIEFLPPLPDHADGVFVEDTALLLPEIAILLRPGAASRAAEVDSVRAALARRGPCAALAAGRMDGGDVLRIGRTLFVGVGGRTDATGVASLRELLAPHGYRVEPVTTRGCLHLKTAVTFVPPGLVVVNPAWFDATILGPHRVVRVDAREPFAANTLTLGGVTLVGAGSPRTAESLAGAGVAARSLDISELQKAEAGLTCLSLIGA